MDGGFPESVTQLTSLVELNLSGNHITGVLPTALSKLTALGMYLFADDASQNFSPKVFMPVSSHLNGYYCRKIASQ